MSSKDDQAVASKAPFVPSPGEDHQPATKAKAKHGGILSKFTAFFKRGSSSPSKRYKKFTPISPEEFQQLKALQEEYDPEKKYIHLWDFAGQQVNL